jgi:hypothetical protein
MDPRSGLDVLEKKYLHVLGIETLSSIAQLSFLGAVY